MALASDPIAVAATTVATFDLPSPRTSVNVGVIFYTAATAAAGEEVAAGSGTRDIAIARDVTNETAAGTVRMWLSDASTSSQPAWFMKTIGLGSPTMRIAVACAVDVTPGTATHYRIFVD